MSYIDNIYIYLGRKIAQGIHLKVIPYILIIIIFNLIVHVFTYVLRLLKPWLA